MALRIQNNIAAMNAQRNLAISQSGLQKSLQRLSSGYRINSAADDAAGLAISQSFRADIASYGVASRNASEASSLLQVAEGAMDQIGNMLTRLKELATQAASSNAGSNLDKIDAEKTQLLAEMNRIANSTEYAGTKLIDGTFGTASSAWTTNAGEVSLDVTNGNKFTFTDNGGDTEPITFVFSSSMTDLTAETFTLGTLGTGLGVSITGGTSSEVYTGTISTSGNTLSFDTIGLTLTSTGALTTATVKTDTIAVADVGYSSMTVGSSTATGTWTIVDDASGVKLTNSRTSDTQTVSGTAAGAKTLDFDQLGIKITLNTGYATTELNALEMEVSSSGSSDFQIGAANTSNDQISISVGNATTGTSGLSVSDIDLSTAAGAQAALTTIDSAIDSLSTLRGNIGGYMNRLGYAAANLATTIENTQAAESVIRDVDMAGEMTTFTKNQILLQAGTSMLAQANMAPQSILSLIG